MTKAVSLLFILGLCCSAQENAFISHPEPRILSDLDKYLQSYLEVWQARLGLGDWKVSVSIVRLTELKHKTLGNIHWDVPTKSARIRVLRPEDYSSKIKGVLGDMEETIVHELIHLSLVPFQPEKGKTEAERGAEETVVSDVTRALLALDRGSK